MREIRLSGSVRGVRRNPYPYRDHPKTDAEGSVYVLCRATTARRAAISGRWVLLDLNEVVPAALRATASTGLEAQLHRATQATG